MISKKYTFLVKKKGMLNLKNHSGKLFVFKIINGVRVPFFENYSESQLFIGGGRSSLLINSHGKFQILYEIRNNSCSSIDISYTEYNDIAIPDDDSKPFFETFEIETTENNIILDIEKEVHKIGIVKPKCCDITIKTSVGDIHLNKGIANFSTEFNELTDIRPIKIIGDVDCLNKTTIFVQHN